MITFEKALRTVLDSSFLIGEEDVSILDSLNRVLSQDVVSDMNMPPFDKSAMDGYACRFQDVKNVLEVVETIPAGKFPEKEIFENQCAKIMTGAKLPVGADCVIMVEHTENVGEDKIRFTKETTNKNICYLAEDVKENDIVLTKGTLVKPQHIAILSAVGAVAVHVFKKPRVAVIATGDELVEPFFKPEKSQIRNSNGYQMVSQVTSCGGIANYMGIVRDDEDYSIALISKALMENDIVLLSGGVSMGDFDFVGAALKKNGINILFDSVAIQPGKPTTFGVGNKKICFGMPGNPVSSFIQFELLAKPLIQKMNGRDVEIASQKLPLKKDFYRKKAERLAIVPSHIHADYTVEPVNYHGSAHIFSLGDADSIMFIPMGVNELKAGDLVDVRQI